MMPRLSEPRPPEPCGSRVSALTRSIAAQELEVKLRKATLRAEASDAKLEQSKSQLIELGHNVERLTKNNEALLQARNHRRAAPRTPRPRTPVGR